jgi:hypothetical protein
MANKYFRQYATPDVADETTIYTVPAANTAIVRSLRVTNTTTSPALVTVTQYESGITAGNVLQKLRPVGANTTFDVFNGIPLVLESSDVLTIESSEADVTFYLSYLELDRN